MLSESALIFLCSRAAQKVMVVEGQGGVECWGVECWGSEHPAEPGAAVLAAALTALLVRDIAIVAEEQVGASWAKTTAKRSPSNCPS